MISVFYKFYLEGAFSNSRNLYTYRTKRPVIMTVTTDHKYTVTMDEIATIQSKWYRHNSPKSREITKLEMVEVVRSLARNLFLSSIL